MGSSWNEYAFNFIGDLFLLESTHPRRMSLYRRHELKPSIRRRGSSKNKSPLRSRVDSFQLDSTTLNWELWHYLCSQVYELYYDSLHFYLHNGWVYVNTQIPRLLGAVPKEFLSRVGQDTSDSKSNRLHVDIFRLCFHSFEVYSIDSSKMIGKFPEVLNFNRLFRKLNRFICN